MDKAKHKFQEQRFKHDSLPVVDDGTCTKVMRLADSGRYLNLLTAICEDVRSWILVL